MKENFLYLLFIWTTLLAMSACHKETSNLTIPAIHAYVPKEIVNSNLEWKYDEINEILSAKVADLKDPGSPYSADSIRSVYLYSNGFYNELTSGNVINPTEVYFGIEIKSLILYKKIRLNLQPGDDAYTAAVRATVIIAAINAAFSVPTLSLSKEAKVVFR